MDDMLSQIQNLNNNQPDFKNQVAQAYQSPVIKPLTDESANLQGQYLPSLFQPFAQWGTGAADMSPAAKLSAVTGGLGRLGGQINGNNSALNFYNTQAGDIAKTLQDNYTSHINTLKDLYQLQTGRINANSAGAANTALPFPEAAPTQQSGGLKMTDPIANYLRAGKAMIMQGKADPNSPIWQQISGGLKAAGIDPASINFNNLSKYGI